MLGNLMLKHSILYSSLCFAGFVTHANDNLDALMSMSLEELSMLDVTMETASKFSQKLSDVPASVYVLDSERIKRSGVRTITEALALIPGINVTKYTDTEFFVSIRGFHDGLHNKLLVLMDGRSLFSPVYGGVYWSDIDYVLADIDRIEVLRGPGGAMWGGNAVNGVINIITKSTKDTLGTHISATYAKYGDYSAEVRQGVQFSDSVSARAFYKKKRIHSYPTADSQIRTHETAGLVFENDEKDLSWQFRLGGEQSSFKQNMWVEKGYWYDYYTRTDIIESHSYYAQFSASQHYNDKWSINYGVWLESNSDDASDAPGTYRTFDSEVSAQYQQSLQSLWTIGAGYRLIELKFPYQIDDLDFYEIDYFIRAADTPREVDSIVNAFVQNDYWWNESFKTVVGAKLEYFEASDSFEVSPQARGIYSLNAQHSLWAGVGSSAVAPSYMDKNTSYISNGWINFGTVDNPLYLYQVIGYGLAKDLGIERVKSVDVGYRYQTDVLEVDLTLFANQHENVRGYGKFLESTEYPHVFVYQLNDDYLLNSHGIEAASLYKLTDDVELYATYTYFSAEQKFTGSNELDNGSAEEHNIDHQHIYTLQALWQVNPQWQFDLLFKGQNLRYSKEYDDAWDSEYLPNYWAVDARVSWQLSEHYPLFEVIAQNIGEKKGYYNDSSQVSSTGFKNEQIIYMRLSHEF